MVVDLCMLVDIIYKYTQHDVAQNLIISDHIKILLCVIIHRI